MTSINLPVEAVEYATHTELVCADGTFICSIHWTELAREIAIALNSHDALAEALEFYDEQDYSSGLIGRPASAALAKVEDLRKKV